MDLPCHKKITATTRAKIVTANASAQIRSMPCSRRDLAVTPADVDEEADAEVVRDVVDVV